MNATIEMLNAFGARFAGFVLPMLVQSGLLIGLIYILDTTVLKKARATVRYAVWMLALVKMVLPPTLALPTGMAYWIPERAKAGEVRANVSVNTNEAAAVVAGAGIPMIQPTPSAPTLTLPAVTGMLWLAVAAGMAAWVIRRWRMVARVVRESTEASGELRGLLDFCRGQLGIQRKIRLRRASISSPAICGAVAPVILIPRALSENLSEAEMRSVLLHELAHFKRGDLWVNQLQIVLQVLYWYNPLLWLANASIRSAREQAVDEMVLVEMGGEAEGYPETLLHVAKLGVGGPVPAPSLMGILEPGRGLTQRIVLIMSRPLPRSARIGAGGFAAILLLALVALPMAGRSNDWSGKQFRGLGIDVGRNISAADAAALEAKLVKDPEDFDARRDLIAYYNRNKNREAAAKHVLWVIAHHPEFQGNDPEMQLNPILDASAYSEGRALWLQAVKDNPKKVAILRNAAAYFLVFDQPTGEDLMRKAQALEPANPEWSQQLGRLYELETIGYPDRTNIAAKSLAAFEIARDQERPAKPDYLQLTSMTKMAIDSGDLVKAKSYADELIDVGLNSSDREAEVDAHFDGNTLLGRIALRQGKMEEAKKYLLEAGHSKSSAVLGSFGPSMTLAKEMLEKGETNVVLEYYKECGKFWYGGVSRLDEWTADVKAGRMPDMMMNLGN